MSRKVTLDDIAQQSNASLTTVSMVLRDKPGISEETRQRVLAAANALGYRRRPRPRVEADQPVTNVALIVRSRLREHSVVLPTVNPFYSWVLAGLEEAARRHRMNLLYATLPVDDHNAPLELPRHLMAQDLDAMLLVGAFSAETIAAVVGPRRAPVVLVDVVADEQPDDAVVSDHAGGMAWAVRLLARHGHRIVALAGPAPQTDPNFAERAAGVRRTAADLGLTVREWHAAAADPTPAIAAHLRADPAVTAVVGINDWYALAAWAAADAVGRRVPADLSLIGFEDIEPAGPRGLTTLAVDKVGMGRLAVQALAYRLAWPPAARVTTVLAPTLITRESVGPAAGRAEALG